MDVSIFGLGYVGCVSAACLASLGHRVVAVDINIDKVDMINKGISPIVEHRLEELIHTGLITGNLRATSNPEEAVAHGTVLLICVGTPSDANGNLNFKYIDRVCRDIANSLQNISDYKVIAIRSTLIPGTIEQRVVPILGGESGKKSGIKFSVASNPEFLREGSAVADFNNPPFTLIGSNDERASLLLGQIYKDIPAKIYYTDPDTASMVKYACNAYHGLKVVFANEIGLLCKKVGIDGTEVMDIFCQDTNLNISPKYLRPSFAFGGSCLPKDMRALLYLAKHSDLPLPMLESILPSNRLHLQNVAERILNDPTRNKVGIIGLTFKPGTDDLRESPIVQLVEILHGKGLKVKIYDNNVSLSKLIGGNKAFIEQVIPHISAMMCESIEDVVKNSEVIVICHNLDDDGDYLASLLSPRHKIIDLVKISPQKFLNSTYEGICW
jgi:GDP-mannose 6-dehydrogenase